MVQVDRRESNGGVAELSASTSMTTSSKMLDDRTPSGICYSWENLNVFAEKRNFLGKKLSEKQILKDVSGFCKGGQLLAIMGSSGAGKTTLLNVLTYRSVNLKVKGDVRINGRKADPDTLMGISAYVQQVDLFTRVFTVREQLNFHAQLRIGRNVSEGERKRRIEQVLRDLGMMKCADNLIGEPGRIKGISGGEKKRLAFACELITNPLILLCDEPTTGIDSFMAESVMRAMKRTTERGKAVISTIHQPSSEVFALFDHLLILAEGRVAFLGTVDEAHKFFNRLERPCPENFNPGDHFIYTLGVRGGHAVEDRKFINDVCDKFKNNEGIEVEKLLKSIQDPLQSSKGFPDVHISKNPYRSSYGQQFKALLRRATLEVTREPSISAIKILQSMFFAVVFGLIYLNQDVTNLTGAENISAAMFIFVTNLSFSTLFPVITIFAGEMPLFLREHWNGLYRSDIYFITRNIVEFPLYLLIPIAFGTITYFMVGLRPGFVHYLIAIGVMILVTITAVSYGYMISCMSDDYNTAIVLSTPLTFPLMLFGGFYIQAETIPVYLSWMKYLSWFMYGFEALSINQWDNFTDSTGVPIGEYALEKLSFDPNNMTLDLSAIFGLAVLYRVIAYLLLLVKTIRKSGDL